MVYRGESKPLKGYKSILDLSKIQIKMVKTSKSRLKFQIQIKEFVDRIKIIDPKTDRPRMSYKIKSKVVPVYDTYLSLDQIKRIVEKALDSSENK